jgi:hypothetical protein
MRRVTYLENRASWRGPVKSQGLLFSVKKALESDQLRLALQPGEAVKPT